MNSPTDTAKHTEIRLCSILGVGEKTDRNREVTLSHQNLAGGTRQEMGDKEGHACKLAHNTKTACNIEAYYTKAQNQQHALQCRHLANFVLPSGLGKSLSKTERRGCPKRSAHFPAQ